MAKILISPSKYVQGAGELKKLGEYAGVYGKKALVLISAGGQKRSGILQLLRGHGVCRKPHPLVKRSGVIARTHREDVT